MLVAVERTAAAGAQEAAQTGTEMPPPPLLSTLQLHGTKLCMLVRGLTEQYAAALIGPQIELVTGRCIIDDASPTKKIEVELDELKSNRAANIGDML